MRASIRKAVLIIAVPVLFIIGIGQAMNYSVNRNIATAYVESELDKKDQEPLYRRFGGYTSDDVNRHWKQLGAEGRSAERHFLELDLIYPSFYGGIILGAMLVAWSYLGRPFSSTWLVVPVAVTVMSDWTENIIQLRQLEGYLTSEHYVLDNSWIQVASLATTTKLLFFCGSLSFLIFLAFSVARQAKAEPLIEKQSDA